MDAIPLSHKDMLLIIIFLNPTLPPRSTWLPFGYFSLVMHFVVKLGYFICFLRLKEKIFTLLDMFKEISF